jgi:hypothetical protein
MLFVSGSGSGMGAVIRRQLRSDVVRRPAQAGSITLTCGNIVKQRLCWPARSVRDEEASDSSGQRPRAVRRIPLRGCRHMPLSCQSCIRGLLAAER